MEDNIFRLRLRLRRNEKNEKEVEIYICFTEAVEGMNKLVKELSRKVGISQPLGAGGAFSLPPSVWL